MPHEGGATDPDRVREAAERRGRGDLPAAELLRLPRAGARPRGRGERRRRAADRARRPRSASACSRRPGNYGCALAIGEGQSAGNCMSYGGPHYGFLAARARLHPAAARAGSSARRWTPRASAAMCSPCRRASSTSGARRRPRTSPPTRRCSPWRGSCTCRCSARRGCARLGETCMALAAYAKAAARRSAGLELLFPEQATFKEFAVRVGRNAREAIARARGRRRQPGLPARPRLPGLDDALLVAVTEKAHGRRDRPARAEALVVKLIYEKSQRGPPRPRACRGRESARARGPGRARAARSRRGCPSSPSRR